MISNLPIHNQRLFIFQALLMDVGDAGALISHVVVRVEVVVRNEHGNVITHPLQMEAKIAVAVHPNQSNVIRKNAVCLHFKID